MDNKDNKILQDDLKLLQCRRVYYAIMFSASFLILILLYALFKYTYDNHQMLAQGKMNNAECSKEDSRSIDAIIKMLFVPFLIVIFAHLRLRHIKSISYYRKELGLDHNQTPSGNPAPPSS